MSISEPFRICGERGARGVVGGHGAHGGRPGQRQEGGLSPNGNVPTQGPGWNRSSWGRVGGAPLSMPDARHPDVGAVLPALARDAGLETVDTWAEAPAGAGPGPVRDYLANLTTD